MKHKVTRFKSLAVALHEIGPFVRSGRPLRNGRPFKQFGGMLPREVLSNLLICMVLNHDYNSDQWTFTSDPTNADGIILNIQSGETWCTEHVMASTPYKTSKSSRNIEEQILESIRLKISKGGSSYASGKQLVVFIDCVGDPWFPNKVAKTLPKPLCFADVWAVGLQRVENGVYLYGVTQLNLAAGNAPTWLIRISEGFNQWSVDQIQ